MADRFGVRHVLLDPAALAQADADLVAIGTRLADAIAEVIFFTGGEFAHTLDVTERDAPTFRRFDRDGKKPTQAIPASVAADMAGMMSHVVSEGTARRAALDGIPTAGTATADADTGTLDLLKCRARKECDFLFVGQVNSELPFMPGPGDLPADEFAADRPYPFFVKAAENDPNHPHSHGERYAERYEINMLRCIFCGMCEEACPEDAIYLEKKYELADYHREAFIYTKEELLVGEDQAGYLPAR